MPPCMKAVLLLWHVYVRDLEYMRTLHVFHLDVPDMFCMPPGVLACQYSGAIHKYIYT